MSSPRRDPKTGTWFFVVELGRDGTGRRKQAFRRGFPTKKAAQEALDAVRVDVTRRTFVAPARQTVVEYLAGWLAVQPMRLKASTVDGYRRNVECYIVPRVGQLRLDALTTAHLDAMYAELLDSGRRQRAGGLSKRSVRYVHVVLHKALSDAVRKGTLVRNVAAAADVPTNKEAKSREMAWWTPAELKRFLELTADEEHGPLFRLAGMTGMRRGEVCGLQWRHVDFDRKRLRVRLSRRVQPTRSDTRTARSSSGCRHRSGTGRPSGRPCPFCVAEQRIAGARVVTHGDPCGVGDSPTTG